MASEQHSESKGAPPIVGIVIGAALMVGGMYGYVQHSKGLLNLGGLGDALKGLEKSGVPIDPFMTVATIGVFLILFPVIKSFFISPLMEAINSRTTELERTFTEVENLRSEMTQMKSDYEAQLTKTEQEAREKIQAQIKEAQNLRSSLMAEAAQAKEQIVSQAQEEISREKDRVMNELRLEVVNLTLAATGKILGDNIDVEKNRKLVDEFIANAEVPGR